MDRNYGNVIAFGKSFIPSLTGFNSHTRPSFKSLCISVTGLKSFESSCCVLKSPTRSDKKFCWMLCLFLRNSLTIKSLFLGSVIFRNEMFFISYLFLFFFDNGFKHGFEHDFKHDFKHGYEHEFKLLKCFD